MLAASVPAKFPIPWASAAGAGFIRPIPEASQIPVQAGAASLTDGFPPDCFSPIGAGGTPPWGEDFNGILNQITLWNQWQAAGAPIYYDGSFSASIGGYPAGAILPRAGFFGDAWISAVDSNTSNPDTGGANWDLFSFLAVSTGDFKWRPTQETLPGWIKANGTTIGNAASSASQLASASAANLFAWHWTNFSNSQCPVSGGRGGSAAADFAAGKTIAVLPLQGTTMKGMDTMGGSPTTLLTGVPAVSGNATTAGSVLGENLHALILAENGPHNHAITDPGHTHAERYSISGGLLGITENIGEVAGTSDIQTGSSVTNISLASSGSGTPHNTVDLSMVGTVYIKL